MKLLRKRPLQVHIAAPLVKEEPSQLPDIRLLPVSREIRDQHGRRMLSGFEPFQAGARDRKIAVDTLNNGPAGVFSFQVEIDPAKYDIVQTTCFDSWKPVMLVRDSFGPFLRHAIVGCFDSHPVSCGYLPQHLSEELELATCGQALLKAAISATLESNGQRTAIRILGSTTRDFIVELKTT